MRYTLWIAWRNLLTRPLQTAITLLVVALALALFVAVTHLNDGLQRAIVRASDPFGVLVVGAKGSAQQLILSSLLLQGVPVGNISIAIYERLARDPRVEFAVPLALGDNVGGARIIGTDVTFFDLRPSLQEPPSFQLNEGRLFEHDFEAVLGSKAAVGLGLKLGHRFVPQHGVELGLEGDTHRAEHVVVGILRLSNTPFDNAVLTTFESVIHIHEENVMPTTDGKTHSDEIHKEDEQITAILVKPTGYIEANQLWQEFYISTEAQAAFPGKELGGLFDLLNQGQELLRIVGILAAVMAVLTLFLTIYSTADARERLLAIMRGLGANRASVFQVVLFETVIIALLGALLGRLLGYTTAWIIADQLAGRSALPVVIRYLPQLEVWLWLVPLALGLLAGIFPALQAYRQNVVEKLFPS